MPIRTVLIEDEESAQKHFIKLLESQPETFSVEAIISTVEDAIDWFKNNTQPQLIFMDIHLSDGISFEISEEIPLKCPIIYTTAYDQYAIKAFKTMGIDYLLKPITQEDLKVAITKYKKLKDTASKEWLLKNLEFINTYNKISNQEYTKRFLLKSGNTLTPVKIEDIAYFYRDEIVFAKTFGEKTYPMDHSLHKLQKLVDPSDFVRLNRQLLVNVQAIKKLSPYKPGQLKMEVDPPFSEPIYLSQERSSWLKSFLNH